MKNDRKCERSGKAPDEPCWGRVETRWDGDRQMDCCKGHEYWLHDMEEVVEGEVLFPRYRRKPEAD